MKNIYLITSNEGKVREFQSLISEVKNFQLELDEIQSLDPTEIIENKLRSAANKLNDKNIAFDYILVEDTSLFIDTFNGLPGPFIKFFLKSIGNEGLSKLTNLYSDNVRASAKTYIGLIDSNGNSHFFEGEIKGKISNEPRGDNGFGWDKIFIPNGSNKTFAEMSTDEKNNSSMRRIAIERLKEFLHNYL